MLPTLFGEIVHPQFGKVYLNTKSST